MTKNCYWKNTWTDSGDRGAAQHDHDRKYHADHIHEWTSGMYSWEAPETVRCDICGIAPNEIRECKNPD